MIYVLSILVLSMAVLVYLNVKVSIEPADVKKDLELEAYKVATRPRKKLRELND